MSICRSIARIAGDNSGGMAVRSVRVRVGHLRQVVPSTLAWCWEVSVRDTVLDGARLEVVEVPAEIRCHACGATTVLSAPVFRCGACSASAVDVVGGDDLVVESLELAEAS